MTLFWGRNPQAVSEHRHPTIQLVLATQSTFTSKSNNGDWEEKTGLLITPNYFHECNANNVHIFSLDIDPESALGEWILKHQLEHQKIIDFPTDTTTDFNFDEISDQIENNQWHEIRKVIENAFLFKRSYEPSQKDDRIEKVINFISQNSDKPITTKRLSEVAMLSESRLLHLFKENMGLPIRNYILWYRLKIVITQIMKGKTLTQSAYEAGFSDQAHMTRTCVKMVGVPPSTLSKNSKFIQVSYPQ
ncbi:MAG: AraC family transcriptional regulator [Balneola sp.]